MRIGGTSIASATLVGSSQISGFVPASLDAGPVPITVEEGVVSTFGTPFTYVAPSLVSMDPATGPAAGGTVVRVTGASFGPRTRILVGGIELENASRIGTTAISGTIPKAPAPGVADVTAVEAGMEWARLQAAFTYAAARFISISPSVGRAAGGTAVRVLGENLGATTDVLIDGIAITNVRLLGTTTIEGFTLPALRAGKVDVALSGATGVTVSAGAFEVVAAELTSVSPAEGSLSGGTRVAIRGRNFTSDVTFTIGGQPLGNRDLLSSTEVTGTAQAGVRLGPVDVVAEEGGVRSILRNAFAYVDVQFAAIPNAGTSDVTVLKLDDSAAEPVAKIPGSPFGLGVRNPEPADAVQDPQRRLLFVANRLGGSLTVFSQTNPLDPATFRRTSASPIVLGAGARPFALALNTTKMALYVADPGRNVVSTFTYDGSGNLTAAGDTLLNSRGPPPSSRGPSSLALFTGTSGAQRLFVGDSVTTDIYAIDLDALGKPVGPGSFFANNFTGPNGLAVFAGQSAAALYATDANVDAVVNTYLLDPVSGALLGPTPPPESLSGPGNRSVLVVPTGSTSALVVAEEESGALTTFEISPDSATLTARVSQPSPGMRPSGIAVVGHRIWVASAGTVDPNDDELRAFDIGPGPGLQLVATTGTPFPVAPGQLPLVARTPDGFGPSAPSGADPVFTVNRGTANVSAFDLAFGTSGLELREFPGSPFSLEDEAGMATGVSLGGALFVGAGAGALDEFEVNPTNGSLSFVGVESQSAGRLSRIVATPLAGPGLTTAVVGIDPDVSTIVSFAVDTNRSLASAGTLSAAPMTGLADLGLLDPATGVVLGDAAGTPQLMAFSIGPLDGALSSAASATVTGGVLPTAMLVAGAGPTGTARVLVADGRPRLSLFSVSTTAIVLVTSTATALGPAKPALLALVPIDVTRSAIYVIGQDGAGAPGLVISGFDATTLAPLPGQPYPIRPALVGDALVADDAVASPPFLYVAIRGDVARGGRNFVQGFRVGPDGALAGIAFPNLFAPLGHFPTAATGKQRLRLMRGRLFLVTAGVRDGVAEPDANDAVLVLDVDPITGDLAKAVAVSIAPGNDPIDAILLK